MNNLQPLVALLAQSESERDVALAQHQRAQSAHQAAQAQAAQLVDYRRDYEQRWGERFASAGHIELVTSYHGFMNRLTQAVDHQARIAEQTSVQLERRSERHEQNQLDELAARVAWNRLAAAVTRF